MTNTIPILALSLALLSGCAFFQTQRVEHVGDYLAQAEAAASEICSAFPDSPECDRALEKLRAARLLAERLGRVLTEAVGAYKDAKELGK